MVTLYVRIIKRKCRRVPVISGRVPRVAYRREHGIVINIPVIVCNAVVGILPERSERHSACVGSQTGDNDALFVFSHAAVACKSCVRELSVNDMPVAVHVRYAPAKERASLP